MSKILTHKEYSDSILSKKGSVTEGGATRKADTPLPPLPAEKKIRKEYKLLHPDCSDNYKISGKYIAESKGKIVELEIKDGIIKTEDEAIKKSLESKGMVFLYETIIE